MKPIDPTQIGKSKAAIRLAELLTGVNDSGLARHISRSLATAGTLLNEAASIESPQRNLFLRLAKNECLRRIDSIDSAPSLIKSHIRCLVVGKYRKLLKTPARRELLDWQQGADAEARAGDEARFKLSKAEAALDMVDKFPHTSPWHCKECMEHGIKFYNATRRALKAIRPPTPPAPPPPPAA